MPDISEPDPDDDVIAGAKRACAALYLEVDSSVADDLKARVYAVCERLATAEAEIAEHADLHATDVEVAEAKDRLAAAEARADTAQATVARVTAAIAEHAHPDDWGVQCVYVTYLRAALADSTNPKEQPMSTETAELDWRDNRLIAYALSVLESRADSPYKPEVVREVRAKFVAVSPLDPEPVSS